MSRPSNPRKHSEPRKSTLPERVRMEIKNNQIRDTTAAIAARLRKLKEKKK